ILNIVMQRIIAYQLRNLIGKNLKALSKVSHSLEKKSSTLILVTGEIAVSRVIGAIPAEAGGWTLMEIVSVTFARLMLMDLHVIWMFLNQMLLEPTI
ncbi:hypothetical protein, partial [Vibrio harveyi]|uniref:hypothetical protein n=1 Tax=Vibrio harveyi TaxID=669 RepID=UPI001E2E1DA4